MWHNRVKASNHALKKALLDQLDDIDSLLDGGNQDEGVSLARIDILKKLRLRQN